MTRQGYLVGLPESARRKGFPCPVCREVNPSPDPRRPAADWASLMRTDFHLKNLIKALKAGSRKDGGRVKAAPHPTHPCQVHGDKVCRGRGVLEGGGGGAGIQLSANVMKQDPNNTQGR